MAVVFFKKEVTMEKEKEKDRLVFEDGNVQAE